MKQCPKCQANISDTAKFCMECGCNIKKLEEEHAQPKARFCPECGTEIPKGAFCPECGFKIGNDLNSETTSATPDTFGNDWLSDLESSTSADVANMKAKQSKVQMEKALAAFEYEEHSDGTYTIVALKDRHALSIIVPEGVVAIADHAFGGCEALSISLPEGLLKIGNAAFKSSADLSSINLPQSLFSIGDEAFAECEMLDIEIPSYVRKIGKDVSRNTIYDKRLLMEKEQREAQRKEELAKWEPLRERTFGSYYYKDNSNEKQPIEWIVVSRDYDNNTATLWSKYAIEYLPYDQKSFDWTTCDLRRWLNETFLNTAFDPAEQEQITPDYDGDKIKIPSRWDKYFSSLPGLPCCEPTTFVKSKGATTDENEKCIWRLLDRAILEYLPTGGCIYDDSSTICVSEIGVHNITRPVYQAVPIRVKIIVRINI